MTKVLIADDHGVMRLGLKALLKYQPDCKVVGEAENGEDAIRLAAETNPDLVIMDLMMPLVDGVEATRAIRQRANPELQKPDACESPHILILTSYGTSADIERALEAGADGAILKGEPNECLLEAIRATAEGRSYISPAITEYLRRHPAPSKLTVRQHDILRLAADGSRNFEIADRLGISPDAVKQHLRAIYQKLGATNRSEAIAKAIGRQLIK